MVPGVTTGNLDRLSAVLLLEPLICLTVNEYSIKLAAHLLNLPAAHPPKSFFGPKIFTSAEQSVCSSKSAHNRYCLKWFIAQKTPSPSLSIWA